MAYLKIRATAKEPCWTVTIMINKTKNMAWLCLGFAIAIARGTGLSKGVIKHIEKLE